MVFKARLAKTKKNPFSIIFKGGILPGLIENWTLNSYFKVLGFESVILFVERRGDQFPTLKGDQRQEFNEKRHFRCQVRFPVPKRVFFRLICTIFPQ